MLDVTEIPDTLRVDENAYIDLVPAIKLSFETNGGNPLDPQIFERNTPLHAIAIPEKEDTIF